jgi:hypothetical protein
MSGSNIKSMMYQQNTIAFWTQDEIKNLNDLFLKYSMPIDELAKVLNKSEYEVKKKLIKLKLIDDNNHILTLINQMSSLDPSIKPIELLCEIISDLSVRIGKLENR